MPHNEMAPPVRGRRRAGRGRKEGGGGDFKLQVLVCDILPRRKSAGKRGMELGVWGKFTRQDESVFSVGQYEQAGNEVGRTDFVGEPD